MGIGLKNMMKRCQANYFTNSGTGRGLKNFIMKEDSLVFFKSVLRRIWVSLEKNSFDDQNKFVSIKQKTRSSSGFNTQVGQILSMKQISKKVMPAQNQIQMKSNYGRGHWSKIEQKKFIEGLKQFGKNWKKIQQLVQTRNIKQVRSHAQKYFLQLRKSSYSQDSQWEEQYLLSSDQVDERSLSQDQNLKSRIIPIQKNNFQIKQYSLNIQNYPHEKICQVMRTSDNEDTLVNKHNEAQKQCNSGLSSSFFNFEKQTLQIYLKKEEFPSHFLTLLLQNYDYFQSGGSFFCFI